MARRNGRATIDRVTGYGGYSLDQMPALVSRVLDHHDVAPPGLPRPGIRFSVHHDDRPVPQRGLHAQAHDAKEAPSATDQQLARHHRQTKNQND